MSAGTLACRKNMAKLDNHINRPFSSALSPFSASIETFVAALTQVNRVRTTSLQIGVGKQLQDIYSQFDGLSKQKPETALEAQARKSMADFLKATIPEIERFEDFFKSVGRDLPGS